MLEPVANLSKCATCGYNLAGLPDGAPYPECSCDEPAQPPDAIEGEPASVVSRITTGLWLLCLFPCLLAGGIIWFALMMVVLSVATSARSAAPGALETALWTLFGVIIVAGALTWSLGWMFASTSLTRSNRANRQRRALRAIGVASGSLAIAIGALTLLSGVGVMLPSGRIATAIATAAVYGALMLLVSPVVLGPLVLEDIGRRCGATILRRQIRRFRALVVIVPLAFLIGLPLNAFLAPYRGSAAPSLPWSPAVNAVLSLVDFVAGVTMLFGPLAMLGVTVAASYTLFPLLAQIAEARSAAPHWTARGVPGRMLRFASWFGGGQRRVRRAAAR